MIYTRLIGRGLHLHPLAVVVAVLAGVELGGVVSVAARHWLEWRGADGLVNEGPNAPRAGVP